MHWYLVHTKPRQEQCALQNLERQGFECYLPMLPVERIRRGLLAVMHEPLFPRYLFMRAGQGGAAQSLAPVRSTKGVSRLVSFGVEPTKVPQELVDAIRHQQSLAAPRPERLFQPGDRVCLTQAPFAGIEGVYQVADGERRVMVLIELLSRQISVTVAPTGLRKVSD